MLVDVLIAIATVEGEEEPSKTLYYIAGAVLVLFAAVISIVGFTRPNFPSNALQARAVMLLSMALTLFVIFSVLVTG